VTIDQLSFIGPDWITSLKWFLYADGIAPTTGQLCGVVSHAFHFDDNDLDLVVDMVISSIGLLEPDLLTPIATLDMCSFQSVFLPSNEDLLEAMTEFCPLTWCPSRALSSWKP
jgi:hypothetical protein